jgi:hypothetical protein
VVKSGGMIGRRIDRRWVMKGHGVGGGLCGGAVWVVHLGLGDCLLLRSFGGLGGEEARVDFMLPLGEGLSDKRSW